MSMCISFSWTTFLLIRLEQVDRLAPGDAGHGTFVAGDRDALPDQDGIPAADRREASLFVDVGDDQPISPMWPTTRRRGASSFRPNSGIVAALEPRPSVVISAKLAALRQTSAAGACSRKGGVRSNSSRSAGVVVMD